jgi:hypothetical protein
MVPGPVVKGECQEDRPLAHLILGRLVDNIRCRVNDEHELQAASLHIVSNRALGYWPLVCFDDASSGDLPIGVRQV